MLITKWQRVRITAVMALVFVAEHADMMILSAMYLPISRTLHIGVAKLGTLSMYRGIVSVSAHAFPGLFCIHALSTLSPADERPAYAEHGHGRLLTTQCLLQAVVVPFVGVLGNMVNRIRLIALGALIWSGMSIAFGLSQTYTEVSMSCMTHMLGTESMYSDHTCCGLDIT